jgi:hypothetical protein
MFRSSLKCKVATLVHVTNGFPVPNALSVKNCVDRNVGPKCNGPHWDRLDSLEKRGPRKYGSNTRNSLLDRSDALFGSMR